MTADRRGWRARSHLRADESHWYDLWCVPPQPELLDGANRHTAPLPLCEHGLPLETCPDEVGPNRAAPGRTEGEQVDHPD